MSTAGGCVAGEPRRHNKTVTGCWTCRSRKVKCDEARPTCIQCTSRGFECQGYGVRLRWMPPEQSFGTPGVDPSSLSNFRKPQRSHIALDPHQHFLRDVEIDEILHSIDTSVHGSCLTGNDALVIHGFGVFDTSAAVSEATPCANDESQDAPDPSPRSGAGTLLSASPSYHEDAASFVGMNSYNDTSQLSSMTHPFLSVPHSTTASYHPQNHLSNLPSLTESLGLWQTTEDVAIHLPSNEYGPRDDKLFALPQHYQWQGASGAILRNQSPTYLSGLEQFLMYHYIHRVVRLFCVIDNDKSPWKTIHLPRALQSTGQLHVEGASTRIRDALRNALLSISAFYLANDSRSRMCTDEGARWTAEATRFRGKAIRLLKDAVNNDFQGSPPKYKEFLATMLSMISINVMSGDTSTCGVHLDGAFRLMSQARIWKTRYSTKARSLHRIYFYLRAIYESTEVRGAGDVPLALRVSDADVPELSHPPPSAVMHIAGGTGTDRSVASGGSPESSTRMTTYEYIYGVPQTLLFLLRDCTRLTHELTAVRENTRSPMIPDDLVDRCDDLERCIMDWSIDMEQERSEKSDARSDIIHHTTIAFHNALIIYFAQNIRFLGHRYLQSYVQAVLDSIEAIERIKARAHILAAPLYWPVFIAGSEAFQDPLQDRFRRWYDHVEMYGIAAVRTGITVLTEVWKSGPARGNALTSQWRAVVRRTNANLMLS